MVVKERDAMEVLSAARRKVYGELDDGVSPSFPAGKEEGNSTRFTVQVHAVNGVEMPSVSFFVVDFLGRF